MTHNWPEQLHDQYLAVLDERDEALAALEKIEMRKQVDADKYPFWVNRVGAILLIAEGLVQLFTPWQPDWTLSFYSWYFDRSTAK